MKVHALLATVGLGAAASLTAAPAYAQDACPSFLCMAGKVQGKQNVPGRDAPVEAFFSPTLYIYHETSALDEQLQRAYKAALTTADPSSKKGLIIREQWRQRHYSMKRQSKHGFGELQQ